MLNSCSKSSRKRIFRDVQPASLSVPVGGPETLQHKFRKLDLGTGIVTIIVIAITDVTEDETAGWHR